MLSTRIRSIHLLAPALALLVGACDNPVSEDDHFDDVRGVVITDMANATIASYAAGVWTFTSGDALHLHEGEETEVRIFFVAADGDRFQLPPSGAEHTLGVVIENPAIAVYEGHDDHGHFEGLAAGETRAKIQVVHGGHADFETNPGLPIEVDDHAN